MFFTKILHTCLSLALAAALLFSAVLPAAAGELPEQTVPQETLPALAPSVPENTEAPTEEPSAETSAPTEPAETETPVTEPVQTLPAETEAAVAAGGQTAGIDSPYNFYFGLLHAHTDISDGLGSVEEAFSYAAGVEGLDFFAVTDHSNSFDNADAGALDLDGSVLSQEWAAGKAAAAAVSDGTFLGIFGFEMTWPEIRQLGHITTYNTPGWVSRDQAGYADDADALDHYLEALAAVPGSVSQFCHPGSLYGDFERFRNYTAEYDEAVQLLEVIGEGSVDAYIQALDSCWHVAPTASQNNHNGHWGDASEVRTVVLAKALTEEGLFEAIDSHRVYATEDSDFQVYYQLDGHIMGSVLSSADTPEITVALYDPTDTGSCTVEVIAQGGTVLASQTAEAGSASVTLSVPGGYRWYFLRITQSDGDVAVTAPVWVEGFENMGIASFSAGAQLPVQGQPLELELTLFNEETAVFSLTALNFYAGDTLVHEAEDPGSVAAGSTLTYRFSYTHPEAGTAELRAVVRGTVLGRERTWETALTLRFRSGERASGLLIDGSSGNLGLDSLERLKALSKDAGMDVTVFSGAMPQGGSLLLIPPLLADPQSDFLEDAAHFVAEGGSLILCGGPGDNSRGNRLLETIGASLLLNSDTVPAGSTGIFNASARWCSGLKEGQYFRHPEGSSLDPGSGSWLVKDSSGTQVLLACEETAYGGTLFVAGSSFLLDTAMPEQRSLWDLPSANQTLLQAILGSEAEVLEQEAICQVRSGTTGETYRIKGYVTAGTSDPNTTFPDTIYLQDDTGGIAVTGFAVPELQIGAPLEVIGILRQENGNPVLEYMDHRLSEEPYYRFVPRTSACKTATNYASHGGELMQIEGTVTSLTLTANRKGISRLVVKDIRGDSAILEIEDAIRSGATGLNTLAKEIKKGRTIRAIGLLHINKAGESVLRVRNCDEVVYVPPKADPTNPKTADPFLRIR